MLQQYAIIGIFLLGAVGTAVGSIVVNWLVRPKPEPKGDKRATYECGLETIGPTWVQFKARYFLYALVFLLFDVETIFLYPWAVGFQELGFLAFVEMMIFIGILALGLWYAWKEEGLKWL